MVHNKISSISEPWLLLPLVSGLRGDNMLSNYNHTLAVHAINDFKINLPNKEKDVNLAIKEMCDSLYEKQCKNNELYFLDKTPRYYQIIHEIYKIYPNAKFIFLFRNPIHIFNSVISTWAKNRLYNLHLFHRDLYAGPTLLSSGYKLLKERAVAVKYENLVSHPEKEIRKICEYLNIDYLDSLTKDFIFQDTKGRMGDPIGVNKFSGVSNTSNDKWKLNFNSVFRKRLLLNYLKDISDEDLQIQGYEKNEMIKEVVSLRVSKITFHFDFLDLLYSKFILRFNLNLIFGKRLSKKLRGHYYS